MQQDKPRSSFSICFHEGIFMNSNSNSLQSQPTHLFFSIGNLCPSFYQMQDVRDKFLDLGLAINASGGGRKRKRRDESKAYDPFDRDEKSLLGFLQIREQMLKLEPNKGVENGRGLHLIHSLLVAATSIEENKINSAAENLCDLYRNVSLNGDSIQRVSAYFADALAARLLRQKSPFYDIIMKDPSQEEEFSAFTELYRVSPYYQFAHFTANQAIIEAFEEEEQRNGRTLHVIDFDVAYGFQWPSLIQSLADKATSSKRICLRITGFGRNMDELIETETRLVNFANGCQNLDFEFRGVLRGLKNVNLNIRKNETVAVNLVFYLHTIGSSSQMYDELKSVYLLNPSVVFLVEQEGCRRPKSFLSRFMESLHYFSAMFDSLDDCFPIQSAERMSIEKNHLGKEIKCMINCDEDEKNHQRYERLETWKARMESAGFREIKLSSRSVSQAKLLLKIRSHCSAVECEGGGGGFKVFETDEGRALSLGWQDRYLITASAWHCSS